ncbi:MAG: glycosyltransferase family 9 protein, partial [Patescibacteria group bacterium]
FHPFMQEMQGWFPGLPIRPFPPQYEQFDRFIVVFEKSPWMQAVLDHCLANDRDKTVVLNPIATPNRDYPYWEEGQFNGKIPFADNLVTFCQTVLGIKDAEKKNGVVIPPGIEKKPRQVVIHPTSSRPGKNWPRTKFLKLATKLKKAGFNPVFVVSPKERIDWPEAPAFKNLDEMVRCVAASEFMIGNDSGIGHLASLFGIPTVSLFKNERTADFWKPAFAPNTALIPKGWLPNLKGLRWRDKYWHWGISVQRVFHEFCVLCDKTVKPTAAFEKDVVGHS